MLFLFANYKFINFEPKERIFYAIIQKCRAWVSLCIFKIISSSNSIPQIVKMVIPSFAVWQILQIFKMEFIICANDLYYSEGFGVVIYLLLSIALKCSNIYNLFSISLEGILLMSEFTFSFDYFVCNFIDFQIKVRMIYSLKHIKPLDTFLLCLSLTFFFLFRLPF